MPRQWRKFALFWMLNWAVLLGLWFLYTDTPKISELLVGAAAAALAATGSAVVQGHGFAQFAPRPKWLLLLLTEPWYVLTGSAAILWALVKHLAGCASDARFVTFPFDAGGDDHASAARRALAIALTTVPPNFIVVGIDREHNFMLVHQVSPSGAPWVSKQVGAGG
jgi:multisubunit Na+/H+ antiporter MnhE subunit